MMQVFCAKFSTMKVFVAVPSICGSAWNDGATMIVKSGTCRRSSSCVAGMMNILRAKWLCQASSVITRMGSLESGSAPA